MPVEAFANVEPLDKVALTRSVKVDTPDTAPAESSEEPAAAPVSTAPPGVADPFKPPEPPSPPPVTTTQPTILTPTQ